MIKSDFALLDVKSGYRQLPKTYREKTSKPVDVVIHGTVTHRWGKHDGTSREYAVKVKSVCKPFGLRTHLDLLLKAVEADDPKDQLRLRIKDILQGLSA